MKLFKAVFRGLVPYSLPAARRMAARGELPGAYQLRARGHWFIDVAAFERAKGKAMPCREYRPPTVSFDVAARAAREAIETVRRRRRTG